MEKKVKEMWYDEEADVLNIEVNDEEYWKSVELPSGIVIDISRDGNVTSIEILGASKLFFGEKRKVLDAARLLRKEED